MSTRRYVTAACAVAMLALLGGCPQPVEETPPVPVDDSAPAAVPTPTTWAPVTAPVEPAEQTGPALISNGTRDAFARIGSGADLQRMQSEYSRMLNDPDVGAYAAYNLGVIAFRQGREGEAEDRFREALQKHPALGPAVVALVRMSLRDNDITGARRTLDSALAASSSAPQVRAAGLYIALAEQRYDDVMRDGREILLLDEGNTDVFYTLAMAYLRTGRSELAQYIVEQGLGRDDQNVAFHMVLAQIRLANDNLAGAQSELGEVLEIDPYNAEAHNNLGLVRLRLRNFSRAAESFEAAIEFSPAFPEAWLNLGNAKKGQQDYTGAEEAFQRALELRPGYADAYFNLAVLYLDAEMPGHTKESRLEQSLAYFDQYRDAARGGLSAQYTQYRAEAQGLLDTERTLGAQTSSQSDAGAESADPWGDSSATDDPWGATAADPWGELGDEGSEGDDSEGDGEGGADVPASDTDWPDDTTDETWTDDDDVWEGADEW
ncbi:MAG: tetratricopeptide repeat protein [Myxococcales bacterium]|nr:tetratricopeptide repeat protein [Myxococcales bacterium]